MDAPTKPFIVALYSDAPRAGKSTSARKLEALARAEGMAVDIMSFAHPIRRAARHVLPVHWTGEEITAHLSGYLKDRPIPELGGKSGRDLLKIVGNTMRRVFGNGIWAKRLIEEINLVGNGGLVIIDDLRFPEEYDLLRAHGAFIIRLVTGHPFEDTSVETTEGLLKGFPFAAEVPAKGLVPQAVLEQLVGDVWEHQILSRINGV